MKVILCGFGFCDLLGFSSESGCYFQQVQAPHISHLGSMAELDEQTILKIQAEDRLILLQTMERFANNIIQQVEGLKREIAVIKQSMQMRNQQLLSGETQPVSDEEE